MSFDGGKVQYACYQLELSPSGTRHFQGVVQFVMKTTSMKIVKEVLGERCHVEPMRALDPKRAIDYCRKEDTRVDGPWEYGEYLPKRSNKRKVAQMEAEYDADPESYVMYDPDMAARIQLRRKRQQFVDEGSEFSLDKLDRRWQVGLREALAKPADDRTVHWVYGPDGNEGKTTFQKALLREGWMCITARGSTDMNYEYVVNGMSKHLVVDIPRRVPRSHYAAVYQLVEEVKNRFVTSTKYRPLQLIDLNRVHVVVMSNVQPDFSMISRDRVCFHDASMIDEKKVN